MAQSATGQTADLGGAFRHAVYGIKKRQRAISMARSLYLFGPTSYVRIVCMTLTKPGSQA